MAAFSVVQSTVTAVQLQADGQVDAGAAQQVQTLQVVVFFLWLVSCLHVGNNDSATFPQICTKMIVHMLNPFSPQTERDVMLHSFVSCVYLILNLQFGILMRKMWFKKARV